MNDDNVIDIADHIKNVERHQEAIWSHIEHARQTLSKQDYVIYLYAVIGRVYMEQRKHEK